MHTNKDDKEIRANALTGLVGQVIATGNFFNGTSGGEGRDPTPDMRADLQSQMLYPVKGKDGRIIAVLEVDNSHNGMFAADEEYLLRNLTECLCHTITTLGTEESFYLELHRHELVEQFQLALLRAKNEEEISTLVDEHVNQIFSSSAATIVFVMDPFLVHYRARGKDQRESEVARLGLGSGICSEIISRRSPSLVMRPHSHPKYNGEVDLATTLPIYYVPLFRNEYLRSCYERVEWTLCRMCGRSRCWSSRRLNQWERRPWAAARRCSFRLRGPQRTSSKLWDTTLAPFSTRTPTVRN